MDVEAPQRAMVYVCVDLVRSLTGIHRQAHRVATRLGYEFIGMARGSSLIVPEAIVEPIDTYRIELLIVPDLRHLRGCVPVEVVAHTAIYDLAERRTYERDGNHLLDTASGRPALADIDSEC